MDDVYDMNDMDTMDTMDTMDAAHERSDSPGVEETETSNNESLLYRSNESDTK
jgi:hypothetical protein